MSSGARHSWEAAALHMQSSGAVPVLDDHDETWGADDVDDNDPKLAVDLATQAFLNYLLDLADESKISAKDVCVLCWYASKAGMSDDVRRIGFRPDAPSGHYQRHLDSVLDFAERQSQFYKLQVVGTRKQDASRSTFDMCVVPGHEVFNAEVEGDAGLSEKVCHAKTTNGLPKNYHEHPVVKRNPHEDVFPVALYMDAMPYSLTDSVVGIWLVNLLSGQRHTMCIVRKRIVCQCGCRGWCTYYTVCVFVEWCERCLADGVFPSTRHDGAPFLPDSDSERAQLAGTRVKKRAACIQIRGDWAEFCERLGFPTWQSSYRPCFCCAASRASLYDATGASVFSFPHPLNDDVDYHRACERRELLVRVTQDQHRRLCLLLRYDKRQKGARGLSLAAPFPELKLKTGDRLEPCSDLPDVGAFFRISSFPPEGVPLLLWRAENETLCLRRCPLFNRDIGLNPNTAVALDLLHINHLGVMLLYCRCVAWEFLRSGVWGVAASNRTENFKISVLGLRSKLWAWYASRRLSHPTENLTQVADVTPGLFGSMEDPKLKTKAAETW